MSHMIYVHKITTLVTGFIIDGEEKIGFLGVHIHLRRRVFLLEVEDIANPADQHLSSGSIVAQSSDLSCGRCSNESVRVV